jgi:hypothetical protein
MEIEVHSTEASDAINRPVEESRLRLANRKGDPASYGLIVKYRCQSRTF